MFEPIKFSFEVGKIVTTAAINDCVPYPDFYQILARYAQKDWGNLSEYDKEANQRALRNGLRLLGCYIVNDRKIYIITEADRSLTTILFADEY